MGLANLERGAQPESRRFSYVRNKDAIGVLAVVTCGAILVIILVATGTTPADFFSNLASNRALTPASEIDLLRPHGPETAVESSSNDIPLRIMGLGASIVKGQYSPGFVGFRKQMREQLVEAGFVVNMVGSIQIGDMVDNDVEAYEGRRIMEIYDHARKVVPEMQPNVFVINVGTNNALQNKSVGIAGELMESLIDYLLTASNRSTVIFSTMLPNLVPGIEPLVLDINEQYRNITRKFEANNKPVVLAEMHPGQGVEEVLTTADLLPGGTHPTARGYAKMAHIFYQAILEANDKGFLREPYDNGIPDDGAADIHNGTRK